MPDFYEPDADWRSRFANFSANGWESEFARLLSAELADDALAVAQALRFAWRADCSSLAAQRLEAAAAAVSPGLFTPDPTKAPADPVSVVEIAAFRAMIAVAQRQLSGAGLDQVRVFRGLRMTVKYHEGDVIESIGRALSSWTANPAVAGAYAGRVPSDFGYVLRADVAVDRVALLFDPSSDGEVVVIGDTLCTVVKVIP